MFYFFILLLLNACRNFIIFDIPYIYLSIVTQNFSHFIILLYAVVWMSSLKRLWKLQNCQAYVTFTSPLYLHLTVSTNRHPDSLSKPCHTYKVESRHNLRCFCTTVFLVIQNMIFVFITQSCYIILKRLILNGKTIINLLVPHILWIQIKKLVRLLT